MEKVPFGYQAVKEGKLTKISQAPENYAAFGKDGRMVSRQGVWPTSLNG